MIMRVNKIVTHFGPEDAYTIIEFNDQLRDILMQTYGDGIKTMLQEASQRNPTPKEWDDDEPF